MMHVHGQPPSRIPCSPEPIHYHIYGRWRSRYCSVSLSDRGRMDWRGGYWADWKGALAMYWGREYWEIFLIAVVVVIVFGVIQVSLGLADRENHRAGRWISDLLSRAIIGALCALLLDLLASWIAPKYWGPTSWGVVGAGAVGGMLSRIPLRRHRQSENSK